MEDLEKCKSIDEYENYLKCCKTNFSIIMKEHKKSYINWKLTSNNEDFKKTKNILEKNVNSKILKLKINLNNIFNKNKKIIEEKRNILKDLQLKTKVIEKLYKGENDIDNASSTLENDISKELIHDYLYLTFLFFGIISSSTFLFKNIYK